MDHDFGGGFAARSVALERAYVHEAYERSGVVGCDAEVGSESGADAPAPQAKAFLEELEPGALVADIGCGNGKYLNLNPSVYTVGADRCSRLTMHARSEDNQVLVCDNLALPFKDNCFDAVISIAVIHHFATAERRALAVRELARVLRIGGRLLLTVWAMEHEGRTFQSQDVLIPWNRPKTLSPPSAGLTSCQSLDSADTKRRQLKENKYRHFLSAFSDSEAEGLTRAGYSPGSSTLSSPNETCYSFVRRALQKLAGSKRQKTWLPHAWILARHRTEINSSSESDKDARDLPIELRRIDDEDSIICDKLRPPDTVSNISRSLTDINEADIVSMVRSQSSLQSLNKVVEPIKLSEKVQQSCCEPPRVKPKLVKQKGSINEDDAEEALDQPTELHNDNSLPDLITHDDRFLRRQCVLKQSSLNEEIMSTDRLQEKERLRRNIRKQNSLNDEYLRRPTFDSLKDSFISTSATTAKRFQSLKNGIANKLRTTTTVERATVISFVKMLQSWKSTEVPSTANDQTPNSPAEFKYDNEDKKERRHSKEDGSDSSKDSSLQSDTSVDSEDSFASVIFIPKVDGPTTGDPMSPTPTSPGPTSPRLKGTSGPTSPRVKTSPSLPSPRMKQIYPISPLSPKSSHSPGKMTMPNYNMPQRFFGPTDSPTKSDIIDQSKLPFNNFFLTYSENRNSITRINEDDEESPTLSSQKILDEINKEEEKFDREANSSTKRVVLQNVKPYPKITLQTVAELPEIPQYRGKSEATTATSNELTATDIRRKERLRQIKELLKQGNSMSNRAAFPIVRRQIGKTEPIAKTHPKLMSLELFNPETDDVDSDSSGPSSPDSVDSVISVIPDEFKKIAIEKDLSPPQIKRELYTDKSSGKVSPANLPEKLAEGSQCVEEASETSVSVRNTSGSSSGSSWSLNRLSPGDLRLLEDRHTSSSGSSSSLERISPGNRSKERSPRRGSTADSNWSLNRLSPNKIEGRISDEDLHRKSPSRRLFDSASTSSTDSERSLSKSESIGRLTNEPMVTCKSDMITDEDWKEEKDEKLTEFAEKLSEKLLHEIDQYSKRYSEEDLDSLEEEIAAEIKRKKKIEIVQKSSRADNPFSRKAQVEIKVIDKDITDDATIPLRKDNRIRKRSPRIIEETLIKRTLLEKRDENLINNNSEKTEKLEDEADNGNPDASLARSIESEPSVDSLRSSLKVERSTDSSELEKMEISPESITATLKSGLSIDSSDMTNQTGSLASLGSLQSCSDWKTRVQRPLEPTLSDASQESVGSEGGAVTNHRYYHVFKKGELEQLIENYVENLHIISSYYDHASWCIVAEKVQVWTI